VNYRQVNTLSGRKGSLIPEKTSDNRDLGMRGRFNGAPILILAGSINEMLRFAQFLQRSLSTEWWRRGESEF